MTVSIPSSRVGTLAPILSLFRANPVSIPSSRVGTQKHTSFARRWCWFPSPQVGSELVGVPICSFTSTLFPSPQVGSEQGGVVAVKLVNLSFHPLKSGRNYRLLTKHVGGRSWFPSPQVGSEHSHPPSTFPTTSVSIPSSRVGTSHLLHGLS